MRRCHRALQEMCLSSAATAVIVIFALLAFGLVFGFSGYLLPFEIVSVHLLVVLIGAAYLARAKRRRGGAP